jgi:3-oxoacyl-[acyl-carrier-protein] synthase III
MSSVIESMGIYTPKIELTNSDLEKILDTSDEWITNATGMKVRHIAGPDEDNCTMAYEAGKNALSVLRGGGRDIDCVIIATNTSKRKFPPVGMYVIRELARDGLLDSKIVGHDITGGCAGINLALRDADALIRSGLKKSVLVIGVDHLSSVTDYRDRSTAVLFGDRAAAYKLTTGEEDYGFVGHYDKGTAEGYEDITCEDNQDKVTFFEAFEAMREGREPKIDAGPVLNMKGRQVYRYVKSEIIELIEDFKNNKKLNPHGIDFPEIKAIGPHLANIRMLEGVNVKHKGFLEKCMIDDDDFYNCSTASQGMGAFRFLKGGSERGDYYLGIGYGSGDIFAANLYRKP